MFARGSKEQKAEQSDCLLPAIVVSFPVGMPSCLKPTVQHAAGGCKTILDIFLESEEEVVTVVSGPSPVKDVVYATVNN